MMVFERSQLILASLPLCQLAESKTHESATGGPHYVYAFSIKEKKKQCWPLKHAAKAGFNLFNKKNIIKHLKQITGSGGKSSLSASSSLCLPENKEKMIHM